MSRAMSNNNRVNCNTSSKKMCKVCLDAGKSKEVYTSHFTRETPDPKSRVLCPTLLAQECKFCHKMGHTIKYCKELTKREAEQDKKKRIEEGEKKMREAEEEKKRKELRKQLKKERRQNIFNQEDDEPVKEEVDEDFPPLCATNKSATNKSATNKQSITLNFAEAIAKPAAPQPPKKIVAPVKQEYYYEEDDDEYYEEEEEEEEEFVYEEPYYDYDDYREEYY